MEQLVFDPVREEDRGMEGRRERAPLLSETRCFLVTGPAADLDTFEAALRGVEPPESGMSARPESSAIPALRAVGLQFRVVCSWLEDPGADRSAGTETTLETSATSKGEPK